MRFLNVHIEVFCPVNIPTLDFFSLTWKLMFGVLYIFFWSSKFDVELGWLQSCFAADVADSQGMSSNVLAMDKFNSSTGFHGLKNTFLCGETLGGPLPPVLLFLAVLVVYLPWPLTVINHNKPYQTIKLHNFSQVSIFLPNSTISQFWPNFRISTKPSKAVLIPMCRKHMLNNFFWKLNDSHMFASLKATLVKNSADPITALCRSCNGEVEIGTFHFWERNMSGIFGHG